MAIHVKIVFSEKLFDVTEKSVKMNGSFHAFRQIKLGSMTIIYYCPGRVLAQRPKPEEAL